MNISKNFILPTKERAVPRKIFGIFFTLIFISAFVPSWVQAEDKTVNMDLHFAGAFANDVLHFNPVTGATVPSTLLHVQAKGSPGRAEIRGFGGTTGGIVFSPDCFDGAPGLIISVLENPLIFTFSDLSLLFANGSGEICLDLGGTGKVLFVIDIFFTGGRGRFEGATGDAVIEGEAEPLSSDGSFAAETGTVVGTIVLP
jgi:hypothetical protein